MESCKKVVWNLLARRLEHTIYTQRQYQQRLIGPKAQYVILMVDPVSGEIRLSQLKPILQRKGPAILVEVVVGYS